MHAHHVPGAGRASTGARVPRTSAYDWKRPLLAGRSFVVRPGSRPPRGARLCAVVAAKCSVGRVQPHRWRTATAQRQTPFLHMPFVLVGHWFPGQQGSPSPPHVPPSVLASAPPLAASAPPASGPPGPASAPPSASAPSGRSSVTSPWRIAVVCDSPWSVRWPFSTVSTEMVTSSPDTESGSRVTKSSPLRTARPPGAMTVRSTTRDTLPARSDTTRSSGLCALSSKMTRVSIDVGGWHPASDVSQNTRHRIYSSVADNGSTWGAFCCRCPPDISRKSPTRVRPRQGLAGDVAVVVRPPGWGRPRGWQASAPCLVSDRVRRRAAR